MNYKRDRYDYYNIINTNECWCVNKNTGNVKRISNAKQIEAIKSFESSTAEDYHEAYVMALRISKNNFKQAIHS